jgi:hypothetical protein
VDFPVPAGDTLAQTGNVTEAFKTGQTPGAQTTDSLLAGSTPNSLTSPANNPTPDQPNQPNQPATPPDKQLGGLY